MTALTKDSLGNYYDVMKDVTLTPAMGHYLDMVNNDKPASGQHANENYARELMQLFTLGLNKLNSDGTSQTDGSGNPVPTYTQNDVMALGRSFTGWTFPTEPGESLTRHNPEYYGGNMVPFESNHDSGAKTFLGQSIPAGQSAEQELDTALTIIFNHPNMPPFVAQELIEKLVTSNPSPGYVSRVTSAFSSGKFQTFGSGKRGDMQATLRRFCSMRKRDAEIRRIRRIATDGKQREPIVMMVSVARMFGGTTDGTGFYEFGRKHGAVALHFGQRVQFFPAAEFDCGHEAEWAGVRNFQHEHGAVASEFRELDRVRNDQQRDESGFHSGEQCGIAGRDGGLVEHVFAARNDVEPGEVRAC